MSIQILILYYSRHGATRQLARLVARGVGEIAACEAILRTVPAAGDSQPDDTPWVEALDLQTCQALVLGSPTRFGSMAAPLKGFFEAHPEAWLNGALIGKPAAAFCSTGSLHGGNEATLLGMLLPLLHHGMLLTGLPYSEAALMHTESGGTPYGASHVAGPQGERAIDATTRELARALGRRVAQLTLDLERGRGRC